MFCASGRPSWNAENIGGPGASHGFPDRTCALAVVKLEPRLPLPEFLLQPNGLMPYRERAAAAREALTGATGAIAGIERAVVAEAERRAADAPDPEGLRFAERPDFYARWLLTGPDESALRRLFVPALLDDLLVRPGWLVCSAGGSLLISVELRDWPPTQPFQHRVPIGKTRLLPPEQLPALLDGALEIAAALERAASA